MNAKIGYDTPLGPRVPHFYVRSSHAAHGAHRQETPVAMRLGAANSQQITLRGWTRNTTKYAAALRCGGQNGAAGLEDRQVPEQQWGGLEDRHGDHNKYAAALKRGGQNQHRADIRRRKAELGGPRRCSSVQGDACRPKAVLVGTSAHVKRARQRDAAE